MILTLPPRGRLPHSPNGLRAPASSPSFYRRQLHPLLLRRRPEPQVYLPAFLRQDGANHLRLLVGSIEQCLAGSTELVTRHLPEVTGRHREDHPAYPRPEDGPGAHGAGLCARAESRLPDHFGRQAPPRILNEVHLSLLSKVALADHGVLRLQHYLAAGDE